MNDKKSRKKTKKANSFATEGKSNNSSAPCLWFKCNVNVLDDETNDGKDIKENYVMENVANC